MNINDIFIIFLKYKYSALYPSQNQAYSIKLLESYMSTSVNDYSRIQELNAITSVTTHIGNIKCV